jgi:adenylate cyclase
LQQPFWLTLIVQTFVYAIFSQFILVLAGLMFTYRVFGAVNFDIVQNISTGKSFWVFFVFFVLTSFLLTFLRIIIQHFGRNVFINLILGKYYRPFEEHRIFMFLDMRDSTTIAEQLGTMRFSAFIQDCFRDFTPVIEMHQTEVYQYVGDEVILTWPVQKGLNDLNCLAACFSYNEILRKRKDYYLQEYGLLPEFKAGVHIGKVRVAEIGVVRRAIAYHGDVMNTTARIQGECNALGFDLLISEDLRKALPQDTIPYHFKNFPKISLKGKEQAMNLVGVLSAFAK